MEQLAYSLKYMRELKECPKKFADRLFPLLFEASEFANMGIDKQLKVSEIMRTELDRIAENNYAREQGLKQGHASGLAEGMAEGMEKGMEKERESLIAALRKVGVSEDMIDAALKAAQ